MYPRSVIEHNLVNSCDRLVADIVYLRRSFDSFTVVLDVFRAMTKRQISCIICDGGSSVRSLVSTFMMSFHQLIN